MIDAAKSLLIQFANESGISLADHFKTTAKFTQFTMSLIVKVATDAGLPADEALKMLVGDEAFEQFISDLYHGLKAKAAA